MQVLLPQDVADSHENCEPGGDRQLVPAELGVVANLTRGLGQVLDPVGAIHGLGNRLDLVFDGHVQRIQ